MDFLFNTNAQFFIAAYLVGGIPFGLLLAKKFAGVDVKASGSGSIGATNVLRVVKETNPYLAKKLGAATLALDAIKGVLVLAVAYFMGVSESTLWGISVLAVIGHCFSPYLNFEGGKGVATGMGVMMFMLPYETLISLIVWALGAKFIRISSLSSLTALSALMVASFILHPDMAHAPVIIIGFILFINIFQILFVFLKVKKKSSMTIHVEDLKLQCIIGILDFERIKPQDVIINITIEYDYEKKFINYADIVEITKEIMIKSEFSLIEDALKEINLKLTKEYNSIKSINLKITKPSILADCKVSVSDYQKVES